MLERLDFNFKSISPYLLVFWILYCVVNSISISPHLLPVFKLLTPLHYIVNAATAAATHQPFPVPMRNFALTSLIDIYLARFSHIYISYLSNWYIPCFLLPFISYLLNWYTVSLSYTLLSQLHFSLIYVTSLIDKHCV